MLLGLAKSIYYWCKYTYHCGVDCVASIRVSYARFISFSVLSLIRQVGSEKVNLLRVLAVSL